MTDRFALLAHDWPAPHLDLLLQSDGVLLTWRLPAEWDGHSITSAERLPDHRLAYLDYEGPVSGDRGKVVRIDGGALDWIERDVSAFHVHLRGSRFHGEYRIEEPDGGSCMVIAAR